MSFVFSILKKLFEPSSDQKGALGEHEIASIVQKELRRGLKGFVLRNLYLPKSDGNTSEIDVLLVSTKGLFLLESKNFIGYVFGDERYKDWTVSLYGGKNWLGQNRVKKYSFYNPIWQNKAHIKTLSNLIGSRFPTYSVIVFSDRCTQLKVRYHENETIVLQTGQLQSFFRGVREDYPDVLSANDVQTIYERLSRYTQVGERQKREHIAYVAEQRFNPQMCPWCGGNLIIRTAKKGLHPGQRFYGCSNYPKCLYTYDLE